jgi:DNA-binding NtrC family response regulator
MSQSSLLLIDDDPVLLQALPETLRLRLPQLTVETCVSAGVALERLHLRNYAAIVSDLRMPGMDGLTLLRTIRELRPVTPVILITAARDSTSAIQALEGGAFDIVTKPFERDDFLRSVRSALRIYRLRQSVMAREVRLEAKTRRLGQLMAEHQARVASGSGSEATTASRALIASSHQRIERSTAQSLSSLDRIRRQLEREEIALQRVRDRLAKLQEQTLQYAWTRAQALAKIL